MCDMRFSSGEKQRVLQIVCFLAEPFGVHDAEQLHLIHTEVNVAQVLVAISVVTMGPAIKNGYSADRKYQGPMTRRSSQVPMGEKGELRSSQGSVRPCVSARRPDEDFLQGSLQHDQSL